MLKNWVLSTVLKSMIYQGFNCYLFTFGTLEIDSHFVIGGKLKQESKVLTYSSGTVSIE